MHGQLWLIITCTASRVTTAALLSIHTASRVHSMSHFTFHKFHHILIVFFADALRIYRVRPNCIQHDLCGPVGLFGLHILRSAVGRYIMVQSVLDCAVVVRSAFSDTHSTA